MRASKLLLLLCMLSYNCAVSQLNKIDSLKHLLNTERQDTNRVTFLWKLAEQYRYFKPDTTLKLAQQALLLARHIKYTEGESRSLAIMASGQYLLGNYTGALNNYMQKLQIEEKRKSSRNYASALNNIGLMYILLADYPNALSYLHKADSTITVSGGEAKKELKNPILVNLGEAYYRMKKMDSANYYFSEALNTAIINKDGFRQGTSLLGLGNINAALAKDSIALENYHAAILFLDKSTTHDLFCEAALGLSNIFERNNKADSALHYARIAFNIGKADGFLSRQLDAATFLSKLYKNKSQYDSAFKYLEQSVVLQDSLKGQAKTREAMVLSTNESLRQAELSEQREREKEIRLQQLQILAICIFIPIFFFITVGLSRIRLHRYAVRFMGIVSLLLVFEFLALLLHPLIGELTHHNKIYELLILVAISAGLVPLHHRVEKAVLARLTKPPKHKMPIPVQLPDSESIAENNANTEIEAPTSSAETPVVETAKNDSQASNTASATDNATEAGNNS